MSPPVARSASVRTGMVLGFGADGISADISMTLSLLSEPGQALVGWNAGDAPAGTQSRVVSFASTFLAAYVAKHPELGLQATITAIVVDPIRRNDWERAIAVAFIQAIAALGLPGIPLYAAPEPDDS